MTEIAVPDTEHHVEELRQNLKRIATGGPSRSPRNLSAQAKPYVEQATAKVAYEIANAIEATHRMLEEDPDQPHFVYHYTSIDTAIALLKSTGKDAFLRMYSSQGFNDPDEGQYLHRSTLSRQEAQALGFLPESQQSDESSPVSNHAYIASFIIDKFGDTAGNNIPYWIHYANDGAGVAIKLAVPRQNLYEVKYGKPNAQKTMAVIRQQIEPLLEVVKIPIRADLLSAAQNVLQQHLQRVNFLYKSSYYDYEKECRVIELPGKTNLIPQITYEGQQSSRPFRSYLKHPALSTKGKNGIFQSGAEITLGPCVENRQDAMKFFEILKNKSKHHIQIKASSINYRPSVNR